MRKVILALVALTLSVVCGAQGKAVFGGNEVSVNPGTSVSVPGLYSDFVMDFEYQTSGSGAVVRFLSNSDKGTAYLFVIDESAERSWNGGIYDAVNKDWVYPLTYNPSAISASKAGQWNKGRIEVSDGRILTFVNGVQCADLLVSPDAAGAIMLQANPDASAPVKFRNVRISKGASLSAASPAVFQVNAVNNTLSSKQASDGWKLLFDGKTSNGWKSVNGGEFPQTGWAIENGMIKVISIQQERKRGGDIMTADKYENYWFSFDFKLTPKANSGVKYFVNPGTYRDNTIGCEYQVLDDELHPDAKAGRDGNRTLGSLYDMIRCDKSKTFFDKSEWHTAWIKVDGNHVEHWLDGTKILEYDRNTQVFNSLVAASKYKDWKDFGNHKSGYITIQDHQDEVAYRNIMIKEFPATAQANAASQSLDQKYDMKSGWTTLWDGSACANKWQAIRGGEFPQRGWGIEDDMIVANPDPEQRGGSDIITKDAFKDFILSFDFHLTEAANGGLKYFVNPGKFRDPSIGCEFQVLDDYKHPDAKAGIGGNRTCGSLYDLIKANKDGANYVVDGWNTGVIVVKGNHVEHWLNGKLVVEYERNSQAFNALVKASKFNMNEGFGNFESGHILIQNHQDKVYYKNIKIKNL